MNIRFMQKCIGFMFLAFSMILVNADELIDRIVAVVDDGVILESELQQRMDTIKKTLRQNNTAMPPDSQLGPQVLERMVIDKLQAQMAEKAGIKIDEETLRNAVLQIAQRNKLSLEAFRKSLREEGIDYGDFVEQIRNEMIVARLRNSQVSGQIKVSEREIQHYLETQNKSTTGRDEEYWLGHILIATPQAASPAQVQKAKEKAEKLLSDIKSGLDFKQASVSSSDAELALTGGDLGWRKKAQIPTLFTEAVDHMKQGDVEGPIRSPSGYHIIKLLGVKGGGALATHTITKTRVRHILIKPNEVLSDEEAKQKILNIKRRIESGEDFAVVARGHSDDKGSAVKGGELGWVQPGALVQAFEDAMSVLAINKLSDPVQTQFGWHLIQVLERQVADDGGDFKKNQAREEIFKRKVEEETELWLRKIRDEAYVDIRIK